MSAMLGAASVGGGFCCGMAATACFVEARMASALLSGALRTRTRRAKPDDSSNKAWNKCTGAVPEELAAATAACVASVSTLLVRSVNALGSIDDMTCSVTVDQSSCKMTAHNLPE